MLRDEHDTEVVSQRRDGWGVGVSSPVCVPDGPRQCAAAGLFAAGDFQRAAVRGENGLSVAVPATRFPAVVGGLSAGSALGAGWRVRDDRPRFADHGPDSGRAKRTAVGHDPRCPDAAIDSGKRVRCAGFDGAKKKKGSKVHAAVDTLGNLLALAITAANEQDRAQVATLAQQVQEVTGGTITLAYADQGYTGTTAADAAQQSSIKLEIVKHHEAKRGFVLLPKYAGWWNEPSAGSAASVASPATTND